MKKIKIVFAALFAVVGIGGIYATIHERSANRMGTLFNWYTCNGYRTLPIFTFMATSDAQKYSGCLHEGN
ncbi:hypothetical protein [Chitinophaga flava]|uniref:Uncharacterized protein n=1 Tax=Chitinophaga flava TaxID=2259036 RepID=A0A365Y299_9BACT|nr:hypothetical protein [Chitinophaga flava]RBL91995.1 hypothetical protein DF182_05190 [Chitinophaga flava]